MKLILHIALIATLISSFSFAEDKSMHEDEETASGIESLSLELRALLSREMLALQSGMQAIIPAYISGNWDEIQRIADKMEKSYILKQSLTVEQKKELHTSLPESFLKQDRQFHYYAGMLKHVADNKKTELVGFYFSKLIESCISCHTQFATHRFPALELTKQAGKHSH